MKSVTIVAPSRIHFGLLSVGQGAARRFGGAGVMVDRPALALEVSQASVDTVAGPLASRTTEFIARWRAHTNIAAPLRCVVHEAPPEHCGLGVGTQLGLAVAWALDLLFERPHVSAEQRTASVGRGLRSAVGSYGFERGGLIVEEGKAETDVLGRLLERIEMPEAWTLLLVRLPGQQGLAGVAEREAFRTLPPPSPEQGLHLRRTLFEQLVPAAQAQDFGPFSEAVYEYGLAAGACFAAAQGGPFLTEAIGQLVQDCRDQGIAGVGQSSWGPTVFCWFEDAESAVAFEQKMNERTNFAAETVVTQVSHRGARAEIV